MGKMTLCLLVLIIVNVYLKSLKASSVSDAITDFYDEGSTSSVVAFEGRTDMFDNWQTTGAISNVEIRSEEPELWFVVIDRFQLALTCVGFLANLMTFITLVARGDPFSPCIRLLLQHQAILDTWVCGFSMIILVQPFMWMTGIQVLDLIICHVWHSQGLCWACIWLSIWNLVTFGVERYLAVCRPFAHQHMRKVVMRYVFPSLYLISIVFLLPVYLQTRYYDGSCHSEYFSDSEAVEHFMKSYGTIWFFVSYATPCALYIFFYGSIILAFRKRKDQTNFGTSRTIEKANEQLTNTAIAVTVVFIISLGFDSWYYMLGSLDFAHYVFNSPIQKVGVFFATLNSVANPFVYSFSMPIFRGCLMKTFCPCRKAKNAEAGSQGLNDSAADTKTSCATP